MPKRIADVSAEHFAEQVIAASFQQPVLVEYWAPWCGPCRLLFPLLEKMALKFTDQLNVVKIDVGSHEFIAKQQCVTSLPTVQLFKDGAVVSERQGLIPERVVIEMISSVIKR